MAVIAWFMGHYAKSWWPHLQLLMTAESAFGVFLTCRWPLADCCVSPCVLWAQLQLCVLIVKMNPNEAYQKLVDDIGLPGFHCLYPPSIGYS